MSPKIVTVHTVDCSFIPKEPFLELVQTLLNKKLGQQLKMLSS